MGIGGESECGTRDRELDDGGAVRVADQAVGQEQGVGIGGARARHTHPGHPTAALVLHQAQRSRIDHLHQSANVRTPVTRVAGVLQFPGQLGEEVLVEKALERLSQSGVRDAAVDVDVDPFKNGLVEVSADVGTGILVGLA
jgi:hypothetical protein